MNIYFACSITAGREFESVYQVIVRALTEDHHMVPTAHLAESGVTRREAVIALVRFMRAILHGSAAVMS